MVGAYCLTVRRALLALVIGAASVSSIGLAPAAHAASDTLDTRAARREIARQVTAGYPGLGFGNVACPDGIAKKAGTRFTCTVQLPGTFLVVDATQTDGRGTVSFETTQAVLTRQSVEEFVAANASLPATVSCGATTWLVLRPAAAAHLSRDLRRRVGERRAAHRA